MSAEEVLDAWLVGFAPLQALLVGGLHPNVIPKGNPLPAAAYARTNTDPWNTIHGTVLAEDVDLQIQAWAKTASEAAAVGDQIEAALLVHGETPVNRRVAFDEESGNHAEVIDVRLLINF